MTGAKSSPESAGSSSRFSIPRPLSHSSLTLYADCPQKYKFKYIDKIPERPRHFFSFGSSVHQALEFFYGVKAPPPPSLEEVLAHYREHWISAGYKDEAQEAEYFEEGRALLSRFYRKHVADFHVPFFVEYQFDIVVEGVPVTGKIDRIDRLGDGCLSILDYKTGKALAADRAQADAQLTMYQLACETLLGAEVGRLSFYHVPSLKEQVSQRHAQAQVSGLRGRIVSTAEAITQGMFEPKPDESKCRWCDYKPLCPVFKHQYHPQQQDLLLAQAPAPSAAKLDADLAGLIDEYGALADRIETLGEELELLRGRILERLDRQGYVRAFGQRYEAIREGRSRWEFSDKKKVLELLRASGLYESVLAPSAPKVEQLMADASLDADLRARLEELGSKTEAVDLRVRRL
ncbi:MAG: PD-(D/E)XK nuclease family protein [Elusimicrobia bacterium]|nr:PD-(D/E)XK nuclease family protein [Elusimicrobiota bacterium]